MITLRFLMAPTTVPLSLVEFVMGPWALSPHHQTSCQFASSVMAASHGKGSGLNSTLALSMIPPVSYLVKTLGQDWVPAAAQLSCGREVKN